MLVMLPLTDKEFTWASTEHWQNLFVLLTVLPLLRLVRNSDFRWQLCVLAGASLLLAIHCRQSATPLGIVPLVVIATQRIRRRDKLVMLALGIVGAVLAELVVLALSTQVGSISSYIDAMFLAPARYTQKSQTSLFETGYFFVAATRSSALILISIACLISTWRRSDWALLVTLAVASLLMVLSPTKTYMHYLVQLFPFAAIAAQSAISQIGTSSQLAARRQAMALSAFLCLNAAFSVVSLPSGKASRVMNELASAAKAIRAEATTGDTLFAVGDDSAYLYFATNVDTVHPIFWDMFFGRLSTTIPYPIEQVMDRYTQTPPSLLVLRDDVHALASLPGDIKLNVSPNYHSVLLSQRLLQQNDYQLVDRRSGWMILRCHTAMPLADAGSDSLPSGTR